MVANLEELYRFVRHLIRIYFNADNKIVDEVVNGGEHFLRHAKSIADIKIHLIAVLGRYRRDVLGRMVLVRKGNEAIVSSSLLVFQVTKLGFGCSLNAGAPRNREKSGGSVSRVSNRVHGWQSLPRMQPSVDDMPMVRAAAIEVAAVNLSVRN